MKMRMKHLTILSSFLILFGWTSTSLFAQEGHDLTFEVGGFSDTTAIIAFHFGDQKLIYDTVDVDSKGVIHVNGPDKIPGGLYIMLMPNKNYFEFILNEDQHFSMKTYGEDLVTNMTVKGSAENELFYKDMHFLETQRKAYGKLSKRYQEISESKPDSAEVLKQQMEEIDHNVRQFRADLIANNQGMFYAKFLKTLEEPKVKEPIKDAEGHIDSTYPYREYKREYLENVDFSDERLLRTPILEQKIKTYIDDLTVKHPDSVIVAADYLIGKSQANREVFKFVTAYLLNKYAKRELMGFDAVYVHIADKYYLSGVADWVAKDQLERIKKDANRMRPLLLGKTAPNVTAVDMKGESHSLYDINSDFTILWFWDSDCGHCQKETPKLYKAWVEDWKQKGVKVFAVSIEYTEQKWRDFILQKDLTQWINVIESTGTGAWRAIYDIEATPKLFILDKDKKIIGKRLTVEQIGDFLDFEMKQKKGS